MAEVYYCGHPGCTRRAIAIVSHEEPEHPFFKGQTHDCCREPHKEKP